MAPGGDRQHTRAMRSAPTRLAFALAIYATVVLAVSVALELRTHIHAGPSPHWAAFVEIAFAALFGPIAVVIVSREPRNPIPWLLLFFACTASSSLVVGYLAQTMVADGSSGANWVAWVSSWMVSPAFASLYVLLLQLFPTGRPASPRFRPLLRVSIAILIAAALIQPITGDTIDPYTNVDNPVGLLPAWTNGILVICEATILCLSIVSLIVRFRRASGLERLQLGWYVLGAILTALLFVVALAVYPFWAYGGDGLFAISGGMVIALPVLGGIAMIRHRLYDVDLVLNRTLVYGALSACVVAAYAALVFGVGTIASGQGNVVAAAAAALCALAAAPLRSRLQRGVNRLLYGARDEPVAAVSDLGRRLESALEPAAVLPTLVDAVARALRLPYAAVELATPDGYVPGAHVGTPRGAPLEIPLLAQGESVGRLLLSPRRADEELSPADRTVLEMLARQAGPAVQAVRLYGDLQRSREQLITAREEERRRLRRDLHDGLGPSLAAIAMQLAAAGTLTGQPDALHELLAGVEEQTRQALADIRRLVYDLRPPALDDLGLVSALREQGRRFTNLRVTIEADERFDDLPAALEVAIYRIASEAITNAAKHGNATSCEVRLSVDGALELEVRDDGDGLPELLRAGIGMSSMRERATELGGTCSIVSAEGGGTVVHARLPVHEEVPWIPSAR
jgi:two-component system, NarL family, sensor kinase